MSTEALHYGLLQNGSVAVSHTLHLVLRFLPDILNRQVKVNEFCDFRPSPNLLMNGIPNFWYPGCQYVQWWTHKIGGLHKNDFIMAAKTDELFDP